VSLSKAAIQASEASLLVAKTNYDYTIIKSPCDGVIIDRRVNIGQTVMAAFNAPGLFLIAKDSQHTQVWASVSETDIGCILPGQPVRFTVNACPEKSFEGTVSKISPNPTRNENAVTYTVIVAADHIGSLLPEMTANLQFEIERYPNVLLVPNDALGDPASRPKKMAFKRPPTTQADIFSKQGPVPVVASKEPASSSTTESPGRQPSENHRLWVKKGDFVRPIDVQIGASNERMTEIKGDDLEEGMEVIWGEYCMKADR
jgi:HlyD family secretion protein